MFYSLAVLVIICHNEYWLHGKEDLPYTWYSSWNPYIHSLPSPARGRTGITQTLSLWGFKWAISTDGNSFTSSHSAVVPPPKGTPILLGRQLINTTKWLGKCSGDCTHWLAQIGRRVSWRGPQEKNLREWGVGRRKKKTKNRAGGLARGWGGTSKAEEGEKQLTIWGAVSR